MTARRHGHSGRSPLLCAVAGEANPAITGLLLEYGARPDDHVLYLAAFDGSHECLRLLLPYAPDIAATTVLSTPLSTSDITGVRLLLDAGADPNHPRTPMNKGCRPAACVRSAGWTCIDRFGLVPWFS